MITNSLRGAQWHVFAYEVMAHIEGYAVVQYGDAPNDQASGFTLNDFRVNMQRYINRMGTNTRGKKEMMRDMLKVAHYACLAHDLIRQTIPDDAQGASTVETPNLEGENND